MFARIFAVAAVLCPLALPAAVLSIAHRGDSMHAPENTVAAFKSALGKADLVETDGRLCADGILVIMHDGTVDRTTDGTGSVSSKTLAQLKALDAGSKFSAAFAGERIPTLEEMITNTLPAAIPLIEHKDGPASAYVAELRRLNVVTNVVVQSFNWSFLTNMNQLEPNVKLGALGSGTFTATHIDQIKGAGAKMVAWEMAGVTSNMVQMAKAAGLQVFVWTVDGPQVRKFIDLGVDGIISNDPAGVKNAQLPPDTNGPVALGAGLVSHWKMDDGLNTPLTTVVSDSKGTNKMTLYRNDGASHWFSGDYAVEGGSLMVDGTNAFALIPASETLDINTNQMSISAWVRLSALPSQMTLSVGPVFDSTSDCYVLYLDKNNKELRFKVTDTKGHAARPGIPESELRANQWMHVAATYSGSAQLTAGKTDIYLNGVLWDSHIGNDGGTYAGLISNVKTGQVACIGRETPTSSTVFTGFVDDVAVWRRALNNAEVLALYSAGKSGKGLATLLRGQTPLIQCEASQSSTQPGSVTIKFTSQAPWETYRLLRADSIDGTFQPVPGLAPTDLGNGQRAFTYGPLDGNANYFRVDAQ